MLLKAIIKKWVKETLETEADFAIEEPRDISFGDYSTNVAMVLAKKEGKNPNELAKEIVNKLEAKKMADVEKIEAVGGFVNLFLSKEAVSTALVNTSKGADLPDNLKGKKIFIEHTQPNPFKVFHIGHLMNNAIGESVSRLIKTLGAEAKVVTYHGDVGLHIAKSIWAVSTKKTVNFAEGYALGNDAYENGESAKEEIIEINKKIYNKSDEEINKLYQKGKEESLLKFEELYRKLDSHFDHHFFESEAGPIGKQIVEENIGKVFEESEGAVIFRGENFEPKTHTRVFLNKDKLPTYEAKEVGLAKLKKEMFDYDASITITANEQDSFFDVVEVAIGEVMSDRKGKLMHLSHGMLRLPEGKMSSRTGNIVSAEQMISDVKERVMGKMKDRELDSNAKEEISEMVAIGAIKYSILRQAIGKDIIFDFDKSLSFEGDSGPYLQYSAVRANSIIKNATEAGLEAKSDVPEKWATTVLERKLTKFYEVIERSCLEYAPQHLVTYLTDLASEFNGFYAKEKIVDKEDKASPYKIFLTQVFRETMQSGLWLLGIKTPEVM